MNIAIPDPALVLLIGPSGCGKSTFARRHFKPTEILSSDFCRALVCDDANDQSATAAAFEVLHCILSRRLMSRRMTVIDATNVETKARAPLLATARGFDIPAIAIVFDLAPAVFISRNQIRFDRRLPLDALRFQYEQLQLSLRKMLDEKFATIYLLSELDDIGRACISRYRR